MKKSVALFVALTLAACVSIGRTVIPHYSADQLELIAEGLATATTPARSHGLVPYNLPAGWATIEGEASVQDIGNNRETFIFGCGNRVAGREVRRILIKFSSSKSNRRLAAIASAQGLSQHITVRGRIANRSDPCGVVKTMGGDWADQAEYCVGPIEQAEILEVGPAQC